MCGSTPMNWPQFIFDTPQGTDGTVAVTIQALDNGQDYDPEALFHRMALLLKNRIHVEFGARAFRMSSITGALQMENIDDPQGGAQVARVANISVDEITADTMFDLFDNATNPGSNPDLDLFNIQFTYWVNPHSILNGSTASYDSNLNGLLKKEYKLPNAYRNRIGCAALAITQCLCRLWKDDPTKPEYKKFHSNPRSPISFPEFVLLHQTILSFPDPLNVTIQELGENFIKHYPTVTLLIFFAGIMQPTVYKNLQSCKSVITIYYDVDKKHFIGISSVQRFIRNFSLCSKRSFCYECYCTWNTEIEDDTCGCEDPTKKGKTRTRKRTLCDQATGGCGELFTNIWQHKCGKTKCQICTNFYDADSGSTHRCPLYKNPDTFLKIFEGDTRVPLAKYVDEENPREYWSWDIESKMVPVPNHIQFIYQYEPDGTITQTSDGQDMIVDCISTPITYQGYKTNSNGHFVLNHGEFITYDIQKSSQVPDIVVCKNIYTNETRQFTDFEEFVLFALSRNDGYCTFSAHNGAGYDTRLLFEYVAKHHTREITPLMRGTKIMRMGVGKTIFQDSLLHLPKSLAALAKGFGLTMRKGYFPYLFNTPENIALNNGEGYSGPIPAKHFFDGAFSYADITAKRAFETWYNEWPTDKAWSLAHEKMQYCINDVEIHSKIMKLYSDGCIDNLKSIVDSTGAPYLVISPWFFPTLAGYAHALNIRHLHEGADIKSMSTTDLAIYVQTTWAVSEPEEYYFDRKALRGGLTNTCRYFYEGPFHYVDIQSSYPSVQMDVENPYPIGTPIIEIHDLSHWPCVCGISFCMHTTEERKQKLSKSRNKLVIVHATPQNLNDYCMDFHGTILVDITPNRTHYHPIIQIYDERLLKVIPTNEPCTVHLTSPILHEAIRTGCTVTKIYRGNRYKVAESKFRNGLLGQMYVSKMKYSGYAPQEPERSIMRARFETEFKIDLGDMDSWRPDKTLKSIAKGPPTATWGKLAESADHVQTTVCKRDDRASNHLFDNLLQNKASIKRFIIMGESTLINHTENRKVKFPNLHNTYLPVAAFVTAYGRLKLWRQLHKLGKRVLYYDTDSIMYTDEPIDCPGGIGYQIPTGDCLGDWETEDLESENGGLVKFVAPGPKTYALVAANGKTTIKLKGACIKLAHENLINYETMKDMVLNQTAQHLPQFSIDCKQGKGMYARTFIKKINFNVKDIKGNYNREEYRAYPYGYDSTHSPQVLGGE